MRFIFVLLLMITQTAAATQSSHQDRCVLRNGKATILVCVRGVFVGNGRAEIFFFDEDNDQIDKTSTYWSGSGSNECIEVLSVSAPRNAAFCDVRLSDYRFERIFH